MSPILAFVVACSFAAHAHGEDHWAVLVAGSMMFSNYRHQADVCHAYQVLTSRGFHPDKIIVMMYDDVAQDHLNPFPGKLYNFPWPTMDEAVDVYDGCKIDYRSEDVTPEKFIAVLTGDAETAGGKVLQSKADDHVFVNFVDHGGVGLIAFPEGIMHAKDLMGTLVSMHQKGKYGQLTFYLETCESGSMFEGLVPKHLPIYAVTAANAKESSWGTWCGADARVAGHIVGSCLGDLFSVNWLMDSDNTKDKKETLRKQFSRVRNTTNKSHVMHYGQFKNFSSEQVSDFQGPGSSQETVAPLYVEAAHASAVDARDATLNYLYHAYLRQGTHEAEDSFIKGIKARQAAKDLGIKLEASVSDAFDKAAMSDEIKWTKELLDCHHQAVITFEASCGWTEERLPLSRTLYRLCFQISTSNEPLVAAIQKACQSESVDIVI